MLLEIKNLKVHFKTDYGVVKAVDGVNLSLKKGEILGIVGESGSGKSMLSLATMKMIPKNGTIAEGSINYTSEKGTIDLIKLKSNSKEMRKLRGNDIAMIFQEPMSSLNPVYTIGYQIYESLFQEKGMTKSKAKKHAVEMLEAVGIVPAEKRLNQYPHELSGGMRQRVMIALALCRNPSLLIADEPTTALDVTIEAQIIDLIKMLQKKLNTSVIFISHDLGVIGEIADSIVIVYMGQVVEQGNCLKIFTKPKHPYTAALLKSIPEIGHKDRLYSIKGSVPSPYELPEGCYFEPRCSHSIAKCKKEKPPEVRLSDDHRVKCWLHCKCEAKEQPNGK
ncbi:MAG TPA: ABC transporter ATP-binding protein [Victivallales bacterium]|nr:ABC transporter ATP-binding protein [Victivallales bacterium]